MIKKLIFAILVFAFFSFNFVSAQEKIEINFFYSLICPVCVKEKIFLENLEKKYSQLDIKKYIFSENIELVIKFYQNYKVPPEDQGWIPITFIGERYFSGFNEKIGEDIENYVLELIKELPQKPIESEGKISVPILGEIDIRKYSLPALSVILGFLDGFNVCSFGALVLILGLVLALRSRGKILVFGGVFILITAIIYGILIVLWYKLFSLVGFFLRKIEILVGILAIGTGIYFLREFFKFKKEGVVCEPGKKIIPKFSLKIQETLKTGKIFAIFASICFFAVTITVVEFPCSAAIPVVYASILSHTKLPIFQHFLYILIYLIFYMFDEILVFLIAIFTLKLWLVSPKFVTLTTLAEAIILFLLGIYYLFGLV